jgi:myo-inositol-1(or 4)-monophosphatase
MSAELLALAQETARAAADLVRERAARTVEVAATKSTATDVVTEADRASEDLIRRMIAAKRPDDAFLGEEGDDVVGTSGVRWIVDPIDGTVNFLYGLPAYAVSIAAEVDGAVVAGAVLNVGTGELFTATAGGGAFLHTPGDGTVRLTGSAPTSLAQTLVATGFGYQVEQRRAQGAVVAELLPRVRDIRRFGSAALDLCAVGAGRVDAYYELNLNPWDHAAGALVAAEAGAVVTGLGGRAFADPMAVAVAASVSAEFLDLLQELHTG